MSDEVKKSLFVSLIGKPNVGKSSLLNMILGEKISIVSPKPQTTRNKIIGILTQNNVQLVFFDTPGVLKPKNRLGNYMLNEINNSLMGAEAIIHIIDVSRKLSDSDISFAEKFKKYKTPIILVLNKIDLLKNKADMMEIIREYSKNFDYHAIIPVSAINSDGKTEFLAELFKLAKPSVFFYGEDDITDQSQRTIVSEIIREKMLYLLDKEIPHGVAVFIEKFHFRNENIVDIDALIQCEKNNHKSIIIGKNGTMIKKIGTLARKDIENMLDCRVNLKLWVKVKENWRNSNATLKDLGYILENT